MEKKGYIRLYRKIMDNGMYFSEPFTRTLAWIDLLLLANHKAKNVYLRGVCVTIGRGQVGHSMKELADRWSWSIGKVNRFINRLKMDGQIDSQKTNVTTIISILNWDEYQSSESADESADGNQTETRRKPYGNQTETNKNDKNVNNDNNIIPPISPKVKKEQKNTVIKTRYADNVSMAPAEYVKLVDKYGQEAVNRMIEILDNYKGAKGAKYASDYRAILSWVFDRYMEEKDRSTAKGSTAKIKYYNYEQVCGLVANGSRMEEFEKRTLEGKNYWVKKIDLLNA